MATAFSSLAISHAPMCHGASRQLRTVWTSLTRPDENHTTTAIGSGELRRNRRGAGVHLDACNVLRRRKQVEIEGRRQLDLIEIDLHRTGTRLRIGPLAMTQRIVLRQDTIAVVRRDVDRHEGPEELRGIHGVLPLDLLLRHELADAE